MGTFYRREVFQIGEFCLFRFKLRKKPQFLQISLLYFNCEDCSIPTVSLGKMCELTNYRTT